MATQQTYALLLEIRDRGSVGSPDPRFLYLQAPLLVEDAFGFKFPVPSEYDYDLFEKVVKHKFLQHGKGCGSLDVEAGNYELFRTTNSSQVITERSRLVPGDAITMAILVRRPILADEACPMPRCGSNRTYRGPGGGRTW